MGSAIYHLIYDKKTGDILTIYSSFDCATNSFTRLSKKDILSVFVDTYPAPQEIDILTLEEKKGLPSGMRINLGSKKLEAIPKKRGK